MGTASRSCHQHAKLDRLRLSRVVILSSPLRPASSASPRLVRVRKAAPSSGSEDLVGTAPKSALAADSLGRSLLLAAQVLARVHSGKSLTEALLLLSDEPPAARAAAQDVAYGVLRSYGRGEFVLGRLLSKPLTHPETQALLLGALYRLETRPDSRPMVRRSGGRRGRRTGRRRLQRIGQRRAAQLPAPARCAARRAG